MREGFRRDSTDGVPDQEGEISGWGLSLGWGLRHAWEMLSQALGGVSGAQRSLELKNLKGGSERCGQGPLREWSVAGRAHSFLGVSRSVLWGGGLKGGLGPTKAEESCCVAGILEKMGEGPNPHPRDT